MNCVGERCAIVVEVFNGDLQNVGVVVVNVVGVCCVCNDGGGGVG